MSYFEVKGRVVHVSTGWIVDILEPGEKFPRRLVSQKHFAAKAGDMLGSDVTAFVGSESHEIFNLFDPTKPTPGMTGADSSARD